MPSTYEIRFATPLDTDPIILDGITEGRLARKTNEIGALSLTLPAQIDPARLVADARCSVWRRTNGGPAVLEGATQWLLAEYRESLGQSGERLLTLSFVDLLDLLAGRIVDAYAGSADASKTGAADDLIKAIASEQLGSGATGTGRDLSAYLAIDPNYGAGASLTKSFARRNVLTVCQELAQASTLAGTWLSFDVVYVGGSVPFVLRTWTGQRGADRRYGVSSDPLVLGPGFGSLSTASYSESWRDEATVVYAAGQGEADARAVESAIADARLIASPFRRREALRDARNTASSAGLQDEADTELRNRRPRITIEATAQEAVGATFGVDYDYGDLLTADVLGRLIAMRVDGYERTWGRSGERVGVQLRSV